MKRLLLFSMFILIGLVVLHSIQAVQESLAFVSTSPGNNVPAEAIVHPDPPPTPVVCTSLPEGMALQVTALSATEALVKVSGLQKGAWITLIYERDINDWQRLKGRLQFHPSQPISESGYFEDKGTGLTPLPGISPNRWQIQVVHPRGVACQTITLPDK